MFASFDYNMKKTKIFLAARLFNRVYCVKYLLTLRLLLKSINVTKQKTEHKILFQNYIVYTAYCSALFTFYRVSPSPHLSLSLSLSVS